MAMMIDVTHGARDQPRQSAAVPDLCGRFSYIILDDATNAWKTPFASE